MGQDVGKLRQVLDYMPCETCLDIYTPEQDYFCGICAKLNREITVRRTAVASDEAVQVIAPEDFTMAKDLRDRIQAQELELEESKKKLSSVQLREAGLESQIKELQHELAKLRKEKEESSLVPFRYVGVKEETREEPLLEFQEEGAVASADAPEALAWEEVAEPGAAQEPAAEAPAEEAWVPEPETPRTRQGATTDDAIARIEAEIARIEAELTDLAQQEKGLAGKSAKRSRK